ncbi:MAG: macro domain-containing protein [Collinsella sp.]
MLETCLGAQRRGVDDESDTEVADSRLRERGMGASHAGCDDEHELFGCFRALVNTREPKPAGGEFLEVQDRVLSGMIEKAGITDAAALPCVPLDSRISLWRGDITTLRVDAVVNAANSQMLGCWVPGHHCIDNAIHTFAGVQLRLECAALMEAQGYPEPTGRAKVTDAFNLPAASSCTPWGLSRTEPPLPRWRVVRELLRELPDGREPGCSSIASATSTTSSVPRRRRCHRHRAPRPARQPWSGDARHLQRVHR